MAVKIVLDRNQPALERLRDGLSVTAMVRTNSSVQ
jgi:multidrug resistance efflux pump